MKKRSIEASKAPLPESRKDLMDNQVTKYLWK